MTDRVTAYALAVGAGEIIAGPHVRGASARHLRDIETADRRGLVWRQAEADRVISFFEGCLVLESGKPFLLEPWQAFVVGSLFGWYLVDGTRRFRTAYIETGKGSGKSPLAAGIGLAGMCIDGEPAAEIYSAATTADQAKIVFKDARGMVQRSPALEKLVTVFEHSMSVDSTGSFMRPVSSEHRGLDGKRVHVALIDELHEHPTDLVLDKMRLGTKGRRNSLIVSITNAGHDRTSVCWREHEYAVKIASGALENDASFGYVCALDEGDDYRNPAVWPKVAPSLGVTIQPRYIEQLIEEAEGMPSKLNLILRLIFCVWTESHSVWIPDAVWQQNAGDVTIAQLEKWNAGEPCWVGLDLAATSDFCAAVLVFPQDDSEAYDILARFWICEAAFLARAKLGREPYALWRDEGLIVVTPGGATDYDRIERDLLELAGRFDIQEIVYDRYWASQLVAHLADALGEEKLVQFGQGTLSMSAPVKEIERLAARYQLRHGGNPVLRWQIANVAIKEDSAGNRKIDKNRSSEKVDGPVSLAEAIGRALHRNDAPPPPASVYEERGLLVL